MNPRNYKDETQGALIINAKEGVPCGIRQIAAPEYGPVASDVWHALGT